VKVSLITPSIPERYAMLGECLASIAAQTRPPDEHLIAVDHARSGVARTLNRLAAHASGEWLAVVADDDLLDPWHLATLEQATTRGDVVYPFCRVVGRPGWSPNRLFDAEALRRANYIPATALIRRKLWTELGGWAPAARHEDHDFWLRALAVGAVFVCVPTVTWTYRFHGGNRSVLGESS
jgi:glycosyltransferase involved in cell wall biosynthesis